MRRGVAAGIVAVGAMGAVAVGSGLTAWAGWAVGTDHGAATLQGETLPVVGKPDAVLNSGGRPVISWTAVKFSSGAAVGGYAVTRHVGAARDEVCRVAAAALSCVDAAVPPGSSVVYTVRAVAGDRWAGAASPASEQLTVPGPVGLAAKKPAPKTTESVGDGSTDAGKKGVPDGDGGGVDGAATPTTSPEPGPTPSAPSATTEPSSSSTSSKPAPTGGGESGATG